MESGGRTDGIFLRGRKGQVALCEALRVDLVLGSQVLLDGGWCHGGRRDAAWSLQLPVRDELELCCGRCLKGRPVADIAKLSLVLVAAAALPPATHGPPNVDLAIHLNQTNAKCELRHSSTNGTSLLDAFSNLAAMTPFRGVHGRDPIRLEIGLRKSE